MRPWQNAKLDTFVPPRNVAGPIEGFALADDFELLNPTLLAGAEFWAIESEVTPWNGVLNYYFFADADDEPALAPILRGLGQNIVRTASDNSGTGTVTLLDF